MNRAGSNLIQAIEWQRGKYAVTTGTFEKVQVISCILGGDITAHFKGPGGDETVTMLAGADVTLGGVDVTILTGTWAVN